MNNERELFEKLAVEHGMSVLKVADAYSNDDTNYAWWVWQKARATSNIKPVAWRIKHEDDDEWDISCDKPITVGNYEVQPLFTIPPSTVPLEKYNKLLDALNIASKAIKYAKDNVSVADGKRAYHDDVSYYLDVLKAIAEAEAEGKEG